MLKKILKTLLWIAIASVGGACLILIVAYAVPDEPEQPAALSHPIYQNQAVEPRQIEASIEPRCLYVFSAIDS